MNKILDKTHSILKRKDVHAIGGLLGLYLASKVVLKTVSALWYVLKPRRDLLARYGRNTWAVVTGATDGIGKEFARQLASIGFNVVLISRTEKKLQDVKSAFEKEFPKVQFRIVVADFNKSFENGFYPTIWKELKDLDVSILINNVGVHDAFFWECPLNYTTNVIAANQMSFVMMTKLLIDHFKARKQRSLIVNVGSQVGIFAVPTAALLASTKRFMDFFARSLVDEYRDQMDIISHICGIVQTPYVTEILGENSGIPLEQCVHGLLNQAGYETRTGGYWGHQLQFQVLSGGIGKLIAPVMDKFMRETLKKHKP